MSEPESLPVGVHEEAALLPWYENGTLPAEERERVAQHLASCPDCRRELDEMAQLKRELAIAYRAQPEPSPNLANSVLRSVAREANGRQVSQAMPASWPDSVDQWFRALFLPRWVPTLAATLLLAQIGLIMWISMPTTPSEPITTRGLGMQTARLSVAFHRTATEEEIRSALGTIRGRIVDGPNQQGLYTIEVLAGDAETSQKKLNLLRRETNVVRSADLEKP